MRPLQYWLKPCVSSDAWCLVRTHVKITHRCLKAVAPWTTSRLLQSSVKFGTTSRRKVVTANASSSGWGALYVANPVYGSWTTHERCLHINCHEMMAVCLALKTSQPALRGHHVLVRSDNTTMIADISHQGGLRSRPLHRMTWRLLLWAQKEFLSLRANHVPGKLNQGADMLSRDSVAPGEWRLHPQMVHLIWSVFGKAEIDLFASGDNCHCPTYFSKQRNALAHNWPSTSLYTFLPIALLPQVIRRIRETKCSLTLVAPLWRNDPAAGCSTVVNSTDERSSLLSAGQDLASTAGTVEPSCLAARLEVDRLPMGVTNNILEARAPSTWHFYALKWSVFSDWCSARNQGPISCDVSHVLIFLQELLVKGRTPSTLKFYVAAIAANHSPEAGRTIGRMSWLLSSLEVLGGWIFLTLRLYRPGTYLFS